MDEKKFWLEFEELWGTSMKRLKEERMVEAKRLLKSMPEKDVIKVLIEYLITKE